MLSKDELGYLSSRLLLASGASGSVATYLLSVGSQRHPTCSTALRMY